ncbi:MAG: ABC transporter ATP-binding protein [Candidatus Binatia bacterium]
MSLHRPEVAVRGIGVTKRFRQGDGVVTAVRDVSLDIGVGEFVAIMGPSGSGKSTLLHLLGGLESPDTGSVAVAGRVLSTLSDDALTVFRRRNIGIVFQAFNLVPMLTAEENVALPLRLDGRSPRQVRERVTAALASVGMLPRRTHKPDALSGGEQQRVAIARALVIEPVLMLADEPTGSLDSRTAEDVVATLGRMAREHGRTVVMVTHDSLAASHAARVLRVVDGALEPEADVPIVAAGGA